MSKISEGGKHNVFRFESNSGFTAHVHFPPSDHVRAERTVSMRLFLFFRTEGSFRKCQFLEAIVMTEQMT